MGVTKPPGKGWQATLAFPGERIAHMGDDTPLVLCQGAMYMWWSFKPRLHHRCPTRSLWGDRCIPPCAVCAQRARACSLGGPDVCQALERPTVLSHTRRSRPIADGNRACEEQGVPALLCLARHVTVPATRVDEGVYLPALIRPCPCLERLLDRRTLLDRQVPGGLPLPCPIGRLLGGCGGIVRAYRHPLPAAPGGLDTPYRME